jgi:N-acetylglutamate synthase-like GNAT family acetyltransferase
LLQVHTRAIREVLTDHYSHEQIEAWAGGLILEGYAQAMSAHPFLVAEDNQGGIVGFAELSVDLHVVRSVYVSPDFMRCGIGRMLLQALEEIACAAGMVELQVDSSIYAESFYKASGFESLEWKTHVLRDARAEIACVKMVKRLD